MQICLSWTLVPYGKSPYVKPSRRVEDPAPTPDWLLRDFVKSKVCTTFLVLTLGVIPDLRSVAWSLAEPSLDRLLMVIWLLPVAKVNLSADRTSSSPASLIKLYLSSSNGKNTSPGSALIVAVEPSVIWTSNCLLITRLVLVRSTFWIIFLGKTEKRDWLSEGFPLLTEFLWTLASTTSKSVTLRLEVGRLPSMKAVTVWTGAILIWLVCTSVTLASDGKLPVGSE